MDLDQLIHRVQRPGGIDPMDAAGKEVAFLDSEGKTLLLQWVTYSEADDKVQLRLQVVPEPEEARSE